MATKSTKKTNKAFDGNNLIDVAIYPISYAKTLMQIGHEPLPPFKSTTIFGAEQLFYPNTFSYLRYIYSVEGITGLFRGLGMRLISNAVGSQVYALTNKYIDEYESKEESDEQELTGFKRCFRQTTKDVSTKCWAIIVSQPFHVMAIRCMAQFVGGETKYSSWNVFSNFVVIYKNDGFSGFFSGLVPRLLFEASTIALTSFLTYFIKTYVFDEKELELVVDLFASTVSSSITYPLSVVSTVSTVSGSGLLAGSYPKMVYHASWLDAFRNLYENNQLKRGSGYFFRIYNPAPVPTVPNFKLNIENPNIANIN